jgi:hypothetical protein
MTDTTTTAGGRPPANFNSFNPACGVAFPVGTPLRQSTTSGENGVVNLCRASTGLEQCVGLASGSGIASTPTKTNRALVQFAGPLTLTTAEWDVVVTGQTGGLTAGTAYYVSTATAGKLTATKPTTAFTVRVGVASSPTEMLVAIDGPFNSTGS